MNGLEVRHQTSALGDKVTPFSANISTLVTFRGHMVSGEASALLKEMVHKVLLRINFFVVIEAEAHRMNSQSNSTHQLTDEEQARLDEEMARRLQTELNRNSRRSDAARAAPERLGNRASSEEVREALNDGQGTSQGYIWTTKSGSSRKY